MKQQAGSGAAVTQGIGARSAKLMMTMKNHMRLLGVTCAVILFAALAAAPGLAQQAATDRSGEGGGDNTPTKSEVHFNSVDPGGEHGSAKRSRAGDASHVGVSAQDGFGIEASHAGAAPAGAPAMMAPRADAGANTDLGPIRLEGFTGLQRRTNRNALIANAPKIPGRPPAAIGIGTPFMFFGANGRTAHNTASMVAPAASSSVLGTPSLGRNAADLKTSTAMGVNAIGSVVAPAASGSVLGTPGLGRNAADLRTSTALGVNAIGSVATAATGAGEALRHPNLPSAVTPSHAAVISGTTVSHIASGPGYLGGPAKDRSGINGTAIRPKY